VTTSTAFHIFDTAGNTTLFVDKPGLQREALLALPCEQAGYADVCQDSVVMAGNEFCVNACLAFAALKAMAGVAGHELRMAGETIQANAKGDLPKWEAKAVLPFGDSTLEDADGVNIVRLPGISHALVKTEEFPAPASALREGKRLFARLGLAAEPAAGIIWWQKSGDSYAILPVVMVPEAGTCNAEGACGSGSLALALFLGKGRHGIAQPSGCRLIVENRGRDIEITAEVRLVARGELWLA